MNFQPNKHKSFCLLAVARGVILTTTAFVLVACDSGVIVSNVEGVSTDNDLAVELGAASFAPPPELPRKFELASRWQWQLQGAINTSYDVDIYDIDLFDTPSDVFQTLKSDNKRIVCYFSAGTFENWRADAGLFPSAAIGESLSDFPAERWLDIRDLDVRKILLERVKLAKQTGCDSIEPDNVDAYTHNNGFGLSVTEQLEFNRWLASSAHANGLLIALKNNAELVSLLVDDFDFVVSEQCFEYEECDRYTPFISAGKPVFNVEYPAVPMSDASDFTQICQESERLGLATLIMPLDLDDSFRIDCKDVIAVK